MAWTTPRTWTASELVTASMMNAQLRDNSAEVRGGGIAIASQSALDLITAGSATQLARTAAGTALQVPRITAAGSAWEFASLACELVHEANGTHADAGAAYVDTHALASSLTIKDTLVVIVRHSIATSDGVVPSLYNSTDTVKIAWLTAVNATYVLDVAIIGAATTTKVRSHAFGVTDGITSTVANVTTAWTGDWTLALQHEGVGGGGTWTWEWAVYKLRGQ